MKVLAAGDINRAQKLKAIAGFLRKRWIKHTDIASTTDDMFDKALNHAVASVFARSSIFFHRQSASFYSPAFADDNARYLEQILAANSIEALLKMEISLRRARAFGTRPPKTRALHALDFLPFSSQIYRHLLKPDSE